MSFRIRDLEILEKYYNIMFFFLVFVIFFESYDNLFLEVDKF